MTHHEHGDREIMEHMATTCSKCGRLVYVVNESYFVDHAKQLTPITNCQVCGAKLHMPKNVLDGHDFLDAGYEE